MNDYAFTFCGAAIAARPDGSLWWPVPRILCVSDLHLGKSERIARRGGTLLPPYETQDTLWRLDQAISETNPAAVICLGDSFDDLGAAMALSEDTRSTIFRLQAGRRWIWIEGNHDPGPVDLGGSHLDELTIDQVTFRHIALPDGRGEISGHYHPKAAVPGTSPRKCFLKDDNRLIMPAFGAYTGGLSVNDAALSDLMMPSALAILTGRRSIALPAAATTFRRQKRRH